MTKTTTSGCPTTTGTAADVDPPPAPATATGETTIHLHQYGHPPERYSLSRIVPQMQTGTQCSNITSCFLVYSWMCLFNVTHNPPCVPRERKNDPAQTYDAQSSLHSALNHALGLSKGNWLIPPLHVVCRNTSRVPRELTNSRENERRHSRRVPKTMER